MICDGFLRKFLAIITSVAKTLVLICLIVNFIAILDFGKIMDVSARKLAAISCKIINFAKNYLAYSVGIIL